MGLLTSMLLALGTILRLGRNPDGTGGIRLSHFAVAAAVVVALTPYLDTVKLKADADKLATFTASYSDEAEAIGQWIVGATATVLTALSDMVKPEQKDV